MHPGVLALQSKTCAILGSLAQILVLLKIIQKAVTVHLHQVHHHT